MKEHSFCNKSNNFLIMQKSIFVIIFISRNYISKQVYRLKKGLDLRESGIYLNTIRVSLYAVGILIFTVYKTKKLIF